MSEQELAQFDGHCSKLCCSDEVGKGAQAFRSIDGLQRAECLVTCSV